MNATPTVCPDGDGMWAAHPPPLASAWPPRPWENRFRVYCGLASVPGREQRLVSAVDSLLAQTHLPERVVISLAPKYTRFAKPYDRAALGKYEAEPRVRVVDVPDVGPISKLFGVLGVVEAAGDGQAWIVLVDDDLIYRPPMLGAVVARIRADDWLAWGYGRPSAAASRVYTWWRYLLTDLPVAQGADAIVVHSSSLACVRPFHEALVARQHAFFFHDDVLLSFFFHTRGLSIHKLDLPSGGDRVYTQTDEVSDGALETLQGATSRSALNAQLYDTLSLELPGTNLSPRLLRRPDAVGAIVVAAAILTLVVVKAWRAWRRRQRHGRGGAARGTVDAVELVEADD